jgi:hypothetical protein
MERMSANGFFFHRSCFRCSHCNCQLKIGGYSLSKGTAGEKGKFFCSAHYRQLFLSNPEAINYSRAGAGGAKDEGVGTSKVDVIKEEEEEKMEVEVSSVKDAKRAKSKSNSPPVVSTDEEVPVSSDDSLGKGAPKRKKGSLKWVWLAYVVLSSPFSSHPCSLPNQFHPL